MLLYFNSFLQKSWFSKTKNCSFCNKTTQDFAEFWEICGNFKAKTKTEDEGILRKRKRSSSYFFSLRFELTGREENQFFCYAKRPNETPCSVKVINHYAWPEKLIPSSVYPALFVFLFIFSNPGGRVLISREAECYIRGKAYLSVVCFSIIVTDCGKLYRSNLSRVVQRESKDMVQTTGKF